MALLWNWTAKSWRPCWVGGGKECRQAGLSKGPPCWFFFPTMVLSPCTLSWLLTWGSKQLESSSGLGKYDHVGVVCQTYTFPSGPETGVWVGREALFLSRCNLIYAYIGNCELVMWHWAKIVYVYQLISYWVLTILRVVPKMVNTQYCINQLSIANLLLLFYI